MAGRTSTADPSGDSRTAPRPGCECRDIQATAPQVSEPAAPPPAQAGPGLAGSGGGSGRSTSSMAPSLAGSRRLPELTPPTPSSLRRQPAAGQAGTPGGSTCGGWGAAGTGAQQGCDLSRRESAAMGSAAGDALRGLSGAGSLRSLVSDVMAAACHPHHAANGWLSVFMRGRVSDACAG